MTELLDFGRAHVVISDDNGNTISDDMDLVTASTSFRLQSMPTCTCALAMGSQVLNEKTDLNTVLEKMLAVFRTSTLHLDISIPITIQSTNSSVLISAFSGVVSAISTTVSMNAMGRSSQHLVITAYHKFAELSTIGAGGMLYASPATIKKEKGSLYNLINSIQPGEKMKSKKTMNQTVVNKAANAVAPIASDKPPKPVVEEFYTLFDEMHKEDALVDPKGRAGSLREYLTGSARMNISSKKVHTAIVARMNKIWKSMYAGDACSILLSICASPDMGLLLAPRSTEKLTLIPDAGCAFYTDNTNGVPMLHRSRIKAIAYNSTNSPNPDPEGVVVTKSGSIFMGFSTKTPSVPTGVIRGQYPANIPENMDIRWFYITAPSWFDDLMYMCDSTAKPDEAKKSAMTDADIKRLCTNHAENVYYRLKYKSSSCTVETDPRCINAYEALGAMCVIDDGTPSGLAGRLDSYGMRYSINAEGRSQISISLTFTYVHPYTGSNVVDKTDTIYSISDEDVLIMFPDITGNMPRTDISVKHKKSTTDTKGKEKPQIEIHYDGAVAYGSEGGRTPGEAGDSSHQNNMRMEPVNINNPDQNSQGDGAMMFGGSKQNIYETPKFWAVINPPPIK